MNKKQLLNDGWMDVSMQGLSTDWCPCGVCECALMSRALYGVLPRLLVRGVCSIQQLPEGTCLVWLCLEYV